MNHEIRWSQAGCIKMSNLLLRSTASTKEHPMSQTLLEMAKDLVMAQIRAQRLSLEPMP